MSNQYASIVSRLLAALLIGWRSTSFAAINIEVSPDQGREGLAAALVRAREARAANRAHPQVIRIVLKPGLYALNKPWLITDADSGTAQAPLVIEAEKPGTVTLSGGAALAPSEKIKGRWYFKPPQNIDRAAEISGGQFYVNGSRAVLAREPNAGKWWYVRSPSKDTLVMAPDDAAQMQGLLQGQEERAIVQLMQSWTSGLHRVSEMTEKRNGLVLSPKPKWPMLKFGNVQRYFVENVPGALNAPGEWLAMNGRLAYIPTEDDIAQLDRGKQMLAIWPRMATLLQIQGSARVGRRVEYITIKGLHFAYTAVPTPPQGWVDKLIAAQDIAAAIMVDNASHITLTQCDVRHTGGYAIWLHDSVVDSEISRCVLDELGAGGIKVGDALAPGEEPTSGNTLKHNVVMHTGQYFPGAVGIWLGRTGRNTLSNNIVAHTSYTGISIGWTPTDNDQDADRNVIKDNVLIDIGQGKMSDLGAIYTLGKGAGTVISGNLIRQVQDHQGYGAGAWGIYNDEGSSDLQVNGNLVIGTRSGGYHLHHGRDNVVRNNLFADGGSAEVRWTTPARSGDWLLKDNATGNRRDQNEVDLNGNTPELRTRMGLKATGQAMANVSVRSGTAATDVVINGGADENQTIWKSVLGNARDTIATAVSEERINPKSLDITQPPPPAVSSATAPVLRWAWTFADLPDSTPPEGLRMGPVHTPPIVSVQGNGKNRCLLLQDGDSNLARYEPFVFVQPDMPLVDAVSEFDIRLDAQSSVLHEWRDTVANPYKSILKLSLSPQLGLLANGKSISELPTNQWLRFKVSTQQADGKVSWQITMENEKGQTRRWAGLPLLAPLANKVAFVGWISDTAQTSQPCIRRIDVHAN